jgi:hypothetical protein
VGWRARKLNIERFQKVKLTSATARYIYLFSAGETPSDHMMQVTDVTEYELDKSGRCRSRRRGSLACSAHASIMLLWSKSPEVAKLRKWISPMCLQDPMRHHSARCNKRREIEGGLTYSTQVPSLGGMAKLVPKIQPTYLSGLAELAWDPLCPVLGGNVERYTWLGWAL